MTPEMLPEMTSSNSFRVDHRPEVTGEEMAIDVKSYIYEFRLRAQKFDYNLALTNQGGEWILGDPVRNEPMVQKASRAVLDQKLRGEPSHREEAELAGLKSLQEQLGSASVGDTIIWFSPPGPSEEGFGKYGFGFDGVVTADASGKKNIKMTANRFENPTLEQYRRAYRLVIGTDFEATNADEFIMMPIVMKGGIPKDYLDLVYANTFGFVYDESEAKRIDYIYNTKIRHLALEYSAGWHLKTPEQRIKDIHSMENIADEARKIVREEIFETYSTPRTLAEAAINYSFTPEEVKGSCPVGKSNNPLSSEISIRAAALGIDYPFDHLGNCDKCHTPTYLGPCDICLECDIDMRTKANLLLN